MITLGSKFGHRLASAHDLSGHRSRELTYCRGCHQEIYADELCNHCGVRPAGQGFWDVCALSLTYAITPVVKRPHLHVIYKYDLTPLGAEFPTFETPPDTAPQLSNSSSEEKSSRPNSENSGISPSVHCNNSQDSLSSSRFIACLPCIEIPKREQSLRLLGLSSLRYKIKIYV